MRILSLFLALLIACSPVEPTNVPIASVDLALADFAGQPQSDLAVVTGPTRIVQRTWTGSDGVVVKLPDLYDTVEKVPCSLQRAADGVARCMPLNFTLYYQDATCTKPVFFTPSGCSVDKYVNVYSLQCSARVISTYKVGAKITLTKLYAQTGTCLDSSNTLLSGDTYDTAPVPPSTFAAGTFNY